MENNHQSLEIIMDKLSKFPTKESSQKNNPVHPKQYISITNNSDFNLEEKILSRC